MFSLLNPISFNNSFRLFAKFCETEITTFQSWQWIWLSRMYLFQLGTMFSVHCRARQHCRSCASHLWQYDRRACITNACTLSRRSLRFVAELNSRIDLRSAAGDAVNRCRTTNTDTRTARLWSMWSVLFLFLDPNFEILTLYLTEICIFQHGPNKNPIRAAILMTTIAIIFSLIGDLNQLAILSTMPFLITYAAVNYSYVSLAMTYDLQTVNRTE
jgi:hypothetical protein